MRSRGREKGKEEEGGEEQPNWVRSGAAIYGSVACLAVLKQAENEEKRRKEREDDVGHVKLLPTMCVFSPFLLRLFL